MIHTLHTRHTLPRTAAAYAGVLVVLLLAACSQGDPSIEVKSPDGAIGVGGVYGFGTLAVGSTLDAVFTISNYGDAALTLSPVGLSDTTNFSCSPSGQTVTIDPGTSKDWTFTFQPASVGSLFCDVTLATNMESSTFTFTLSGTGQTTISPEPLAPPASALGTWWQDGGTATDRNEYVFTADNVINTVYVAGAILSSINFKADNQLYADNNMADTGFFGSVPGANAYVIESRTLGTVNTTFSFTYQVPVMSLTITGTGAGGPYIFNKQ